MSTSNSGAKGKEIYNLCLVPRATYISRDDVSKVLCLAKSGLTKEDVIYLKDNLASALVMTASYSKRYLASLIPNERTGLILEASPCTYDDFLLAIDDKDQKQFDILYRHKVRTYSHAMEEALFLECDRLGWYTSAKTILKTLPWNDKYLTSDNMTHYLDLLVKPMVVPVVSDTCIPVVPIVSDTRT